MRIEKARLLLQQQRYELAEKELRGALAEVPEDSSAHALLAICLGQLGRAEDALGAARRAVQCGPEQPFTHYVLSGAFDQLDRFDEAEAAIAESIRLDPEDADYRARLSSLHLQRRRWEPALAQADAGLSFDPQNAECLNFRTMALNKLGRANEARAASRGALGANPEDARTQASAGWHELEHGHHEAALGHFREALRIDSSLAWAREGIVEALKARNPLYRLMLGYFLWTSRLKGRAMWGLILGGYVLSKVLREWAKSNPEWAPYVWVILGPYFAFVLMTWVADPLFNLVLRLDPLGRVALTKMQLIAANWFGGLLLGAVAAAGGWLLLGQTSFGMAALVSGLMAIPVSTALAVDAGKGRRILVSYALGLGACGVALVATSLQATAGGLFGALLAVFLIGIVTFGWVANWLLIRVRD